MDDQGDYNDQTRSARENTFRYSLDTTHLGMVAEKPMKYGALNQSKEGKDNTDEE